MTPSSTDTGRRDATVADDSDASDDSDARSADAQAGSRSPPRVGVLGAGQLGRMLGVAAVPLGIEIAFASPRESDSTRGIGTTTTVLPDDVERMRAFVAGCDVITVENEWAPCAEVAALADALATERGRPLPCFPSPAALAKIADKLDQKQHLAHSGLPLGPYRGCASLAEASAAADTFGWPVVVKRRRGAYDGYGNRTARSPEELSAAWAALAQEDGLIVEAWAPFVRELAVVVARRPGGETATYPVALTEQDGHRCAAVEVPAPVAAEVAAAARALARAAVEAFDVVGVCAVELFELADGSLWVNELAPRPHNSGHYSIEACPSSQFDNHLRAVLDLPLGDPELRVPAAIMVNILGPSDSDEAIPDISGALALAGVSVHLYGKTQARPGRKLGHLTVTGDDPTELRARAEAALSALRW